MPCKKWKPGTYLPGCRGKPQTNFILQAQLPEPCAKARGCSGGERCSPPNPGTRRACETFRHTEGEEKSTWFVCVCAHVCNMCPAAGKERAVLSTRVPQGKAGELYLQRRSLVLYHLLPFSYQPPLSLESGPIHWFV